MASRDRREGAGTRIASRLHRAADEGLGCARARRRGGDREIDALARRRRACARARVARSLVATGGGRARPRARGAGRPASKACSTTYCRRSRRRGGARSKSRCWSKRRLATRSIAARSTWRCVTRCNFSASASRCCSRWTMSSGSTRPRRVRSRSRFAGSPPTACVVLLARRLVDGELPSEIEQALDPQRVAVGPLSVGALHQFLRDRLGRSFARQTLLRIHEQSGGNPFFALELGARARRGRRPDAAAAGSRDGRRPPSHEDLWNSGCHPRGACVRSRFGGALRDAAGAGRRRVGGARSRTRRTR